MSILRAWAPVVAGRHARFLCARSFHASSYWRKPVQLAYERIEAGSRDSDVAKHTSGLVVCHGLYGSKQNWGSLAKGMANEFGVPVYTLDLRNHGSSPHADTMAYKDMAEDIARFFDDHNLSNMALVGHSMGGKAAMAMALDPALPEDRLTHLVVVDMSPAEGAISPEFMEIERAQVKSRTEADKIMQDTEQFLLTNLQRDGDVMRFRIPLDNLERELSSIGEFPYAPPRADGEPPERQWMGRTLFIKGERSKYINRKNLPLCEAYFPHMKLATLDTGHWCQSEKPRDFVRVLREFLVA